MVRKKTSSGSQQQKPANPKYDVLAKAIRRHADESKLFKDGLPIDAYAIRADEYDTWTWQLPHHTKAIGSKTTENTVDFAALDHCTLLLSRYGDQGVRCHADPELIILAARHLAGHYRSAGLQIPVALCVLI